MFSLRSSLTLLTATRIGQSHIIIVLESVSKTRGTQHDRQYMYKEKYKETKHNGETEHRAYIRVKGKALL